jgi:hypothetical protein
MNDVAVQPSIAPVMSLTIHDRCDLCGAQAYGSALMPRAQNPLLWCGHHYEAFKFDMEFKGAIMVDERYRIEEEESRRKATGVSA